MPNRKRIAADATAVPRNAFAIGGKHRSNIARGPIGLATGLLLCLALLWGPVPRASALNFGVGWSGDYAGTEAEMGIVKYSGAGLLRVPFDLGRCNGANWAPCDHLVEKAWENGLTIQPYLVWKVNDETPFLNSGNPGWGTWYVWSKEIVERYGYNGDFWWGKSNPRPVTDWEVWNEPNLAENNPQWTKKQCETEKLTIFYKPDGSFLNCVQPEEYGAFLVYTAAAIQAASQKRAAKNTGVMFGGIAYPYGLEYGKFLSGAYSVPGVASSYSTLSIHPYGFDFNHYSGEKTISEVESNVNGVRSYLNGLSGGSERSLSITELGWCLDDYGDAHFPKVLNEAEQQNLLTASFNWIKKVATEKKIQSLFWYNTRDLSIPKWAYTCGLRNQAGSYRPAWTAFQEETGVPQVKPQPPVAVTQAPNQIGESSAMLNGSVNPGGVPTTYWFEIGTTTNYGVAVPVTPNSAGSGSGTAGVSVSAEGLRAGATYHVRLVATNFLGTSYGGDQTFKTSSSSYMLGVSSGAGVSQWTDVLNTEAPVRSVTGDFNADGKADVVRVDSDGSGKYRYMLGISNGTGVSSWSQVLGGMSQPTAMSVGDFNGDGKADVVSVEPDGSGKYRYMVGTSSGSGISSWSQVLGGMSQPTAMSVGDFNGDGKADVVSTEPDGSGKYRYMVGISSGAGISSWSQVLGGMSQPTAMSVGDFNGDGNADIVAAEPDGSGKYHYMVGISTGTGISSWSLVLPGMSQPQAMSLGDFNGDGKADIVAAEPDGSGKYHYMLGISNGTGVSSWSQVLGGMSQPTAMSVGDFNGDGKADIVAAEPDGSGKYRYMAGTSSGSGISSWSQVLGGMSRPTPMSVGDFNGDGKADVVSVETR